MSFQYTETIVLEHKTCGNCSGTFALNARWLEEKRRNKGGYHCPYCQTHWGWWKSEAEKLKEELAEKEAQLRSANESAMTNLRMRVAADTRRQEAEMKLRRVEKGVCPCCNRTFINLQRHMKTKHPSAPACA